MSSASPSVAALLVSHDGERWLPTVLDGLTAQQVSPSRSIAVDTGSLDESALIAERVVDDVLRLPSDVGYPAAVRAGLERLELDRDPVEWIWLLHDDATPAPDALARLLEAAAEHPEADILGPKLREWPSLRRMLEVGVTISGTGRRETGLEPGEYDQGQHDDVRRVLAVNTAGMLVRRRVLEDLGGFDDLLPIFGNDLDFGWRAATAGHTTVVAPRAVVFHAEAATRGLRRSALTGRHPHYQQRRAALYTLLVNTRSPLLAWSVVRLALGTLIRMLGFLVVRSPREALDDLAALLSVYSRPGVIREQRRARRRDDARTVGDLLAPPWLPYRHGLDFVGDVAAAVTNQAADVAERRRAAAARLDPSSFAAQRQEIREGDELADTGLLARYLTSPIALLLTAVVIVGLVGSRIVVGEVSGGGLSLAPGSAREWWGLHLEAWHPLGTGSAVPAPAYVLPLALLGSVVGSGGAVSLILLTCLPVALWGAWRLLRVVGRLVDPLGAPRWVLLWGSASYAVVPMVSGAWGEGRLGLVVAAALLPWLAHAAVGFADPDTDRRWRAAWRTALLLALITAFAPQVWFLALVLGLLVAALARVAMSSSRSSSSSSSSSSSDARQVWGPPALALGLVPVLLAPWWLPALREGAGAALLLETGRLPTTSLDSAGLAFGRLGDLGGEGSLGAPLWLGMLLVLAAVLALVPRRTRIPVTVCWIVAAVTAAFALVLSTISLRIGPLETDPGLGLPLVVLQGALVAAAVIGAQGVARGARHGVTAVLAVAAIIPIGGLGWFVASDASALTDQPASTVPLYMTQSAMQGPEHGIVVVRGSVDTGLEYDIRRGDGVTLGEDEVLALDPEDPAYTEVVQDLAARPSPEVIERLGDLGIEYVVLPAPADASVAASLDATLGLSQASAEDRRTRAWKVDQDLAPDAVSGPGSLLRTLLLWLQAGLVLVALVFCLPTLRGGRR